MTVLREFYIKVGSKVDKQGLRDVQAQMKAVEWQAIKVGAQLGLAGLAIKKFVDAGSQKELSRLTFSTMLGSLEKSEAMMKRIEKLSIETPFKFEEAESTVKMMLAMGAAEKDVIDETRMLGDIAAGLNVPMSRLALNFGQVRTMGKLTGREMRDFAVSGVPLLSVLSKTTGKTKKQITEMISAGGVSFDMVKKAFQKMTSEGGRFDNLMKKASFTTKGLASNIGVLGDLAVRNIGEKFNKKVMKDLLKNFYMWAKESNNMERLMKFGLGGAATFLLGKVSQLGLAFANVGRGGVLMWAKTLVGPLLLGGLIAGVSLLIEDMWLTWMDPKAKTFTNWFLNKLENDYPKAFGNIKGSMKSIHMALAGIGYVASKVFGTKEQQRIWGELYEEYGGQASKSFKKASGIRQYGFSTPDIINLPGIKQLIPSLMGGTVGAGKSDAKFILAASLIDLIGNVGSPQAPAMQNGGGKTIILQNPQFSGVNNMDDFYLQLEAETNRVSE